MGIMQCNFGLRDWVPTGEGGCGYQYLSGRRGEQRFMLPLPRIEPRIPVVQQSLQALSYCSRSAVFFCFVLNPIFICKL
jgi:hypothetical protein